MGTMPEFLTDQEPVFHNEKLPPSAIEYLKKQQYGQANDRLTIRRESAIQRAQTVGWPPFSILNFNPVWLNVECAHVNWKVPPFNYLPEDKSNKRTFHFGGKERTASLFVCSNLEGFSKPISVREGPEPNSPEVDRDWNIVFPIEQVRLFEFQYNNPSDPASMGGVITFQGDGSNIDGNSQRDGVIHVPQAKRLKNRELQFYTAPVSFIQKMNDTLTRQKNYCLNKLMEAKKFHSDPDPLIQKSVTNIHQAWGQFAADMGWQDIGRMDFLLPRDADQGCAKCGRMRKTGTALFCECGNPYDAFEAFMAGMDVSDGLLAALPGEQLEKVREEMKRRRNLFRVEEDEGEETVRRSRKPRE